jgi:DNA-binding response OmpR family regulator
MGSDRVGSPPATAHQDAGPSAGGLAADRAANAQRILLVEDDRDFIAVMFEALTMNGFSVLTADDGQQALDLLEKGIRPRLVIMDLKLPRVSGIDILTYMREHRELRDIPVLVLTALPRGGTVVADRVIPKPVDLDVVLGAVKALLRQHETRT